MEVQIDMGWIGTNGKHYPPACPIITKDRSRVGHIEQWSFCTLHEIWTDQCGCPAMQGYFEDGK